MPYVQPKRITRRDKQRYTRVRCNGSSCVMEPAEATAFVEYMRIDEQDEEITLTDVWMTREQFNRLPEFQGY